MLLFMLRQDVNFCRINVLTSLKSLLKTVSQVAYMIDAVLGWARLKNMGNKEEKFEGLWLRKEMD